MGAHEMEKILVIDDNEVICDMLYDVLNEWGFCAEKAYQGMKALPLVDEFQPDLVLLDVMLPGMNGFEICRRIKSDPEKEHIAVILLTVLSDAGGQCGRRSVPEQARELQGTPKADRISAGEEKEACRHGKGGECVSVHFKPGAVYGFGIIQPGQRSEKILRPSAAYFKLFRK